MLSGTATETTPVSGGEVRAFVAGSWPRVLKAPWGHPLCESVRRVVIPPLNLDRPIWYDDYSRKGGVPCVDPKALPGVASRRTVKALRRDVRVSVLFQAEAAHKVSGLPPYRGSACGSVSAVLPGK